MDWRADPGGVRRLLARARERGDRRRGGTCAGRGVWSDRDWRVLLRDHRRQGHRPPAERPRGQANRASRHDRDRDRVRRGDRLAGRRHQGRSLGLGAAVDRDHDRTAAAMARPPGPRPPLSAGRMGVDRRTRDPRRDDVRHAVGCDHGNRRGVLLLSTALAGFHDLAGVRRAEQATAETAALSASAGAQP